MESNGCTNNSGVDPNKVIHVPLRTLKQPEINFKRTIIIIVLSLLVALAASCSPSARLARLVKKHPELVRVDTIFIHDTIIVEGVKYDTVTKFLTNTTVEVINNERVRLQYFYDTITNEIWHEVECKEQRIVYERQFTYPTIEQVPVLPTWVWVVGIGLLALFVYDRFIR